MVGRNRAAFLQRAGEAAALTNPAHAKTPAATIMAALANEPY